MIKLKSLLVERIDYHDTAEYLVKQYKLRSKVRFGKVKGQNEADYDWVKDVINLKRNYPNVKEFIVSVLHEIDHAKMRKRMGWKKYEYEYINHIHTSNQHTSTCNFINQYTKIRNI